jgi:hypothetical protein
MNAMFTHVHLLLLLIIYQPISDWKATVSTLNRHLVSSFLSLFCKIRQCRYPDARGIERIGLRFEKFNDASPRNTKKAALAC